MTNGLRCSQYEAKERQQADIMHQLQAAQQQPTAPTAAPKRKHVEKIELGGGSFPNRKHVGRDTPNWGGAAAYPSIGCGAKDRPRLRVMHCYYIFKRNGVYIRRGLDTGCLACWPRLCLATWLPRGCST